jgi:hypothetical protein
MANSSNISKTAVPVDISYAQFYIVFIRTQYHWHGIKAGVYCRHCSPIFSKEEDYIQRYEQKGILGADLGVSEPSKHSPISLGLILFYRRYRRELSQICLKNACKKFHKESKEKIGLRNNNSKFGVLTTDFENR